MILVSVTHNAYSTFQLSTRNQHTISSMPEQVESSSYKKARLSNGAESLSGDEKHSSYKPAYKLKFSISGKKLGSLTSVKISADGSKLALSSSAGIVWVYNLADCSLLATLLGHTKGISAIAFSPNDSNILASGSDDLSIRLWNVSTQKCLRVLKKHTFHVTTLQFNSKGNVLVSGSADETIVVWDLAQGRSLRTLAAHSDPVSSISLSPDDSIIASASHDGLMRLFDTETGQCLKTLVYNSTSHGTATASTSDVVNFPISNVLFSPNGKYVLSSSLDGKIRLWDYMGNRVVKTYLGPDGSSVNKKYNSGSCFVVHTPNPLVVSGSDLHGILLWDLQSKEIVGQLAPGSTILDVTTSFEGSLLVSCSLDGVANVYELDKEVKMKPESD